MEKKDMGFEGLSAATTYEVNVAEKSLQIMRQSGGKGPNEELIRLCFDTMDKLLPSLGLYQTVFTALRNDLYNGVYSTRLTTEEIKSSTKEIPLRRIPFFTILERIDGARKEETEKLWHTITELEKSNKISKEEGLSLSKALKTSEEAVAAKDHVINEMTYQLKGKDKEISTLLTNIKNVTRKSARDMNAMQEEIKALQNEISSLEEEKAVLQVFKSEWEAMEQVFYEKRLMTDTEQSQDVQDVESKFDTDRKRYVKSIADIQKMEQQLLNMKNLIIKNYDKLLDQENRETFGNDSSSAKKQQTIENDDQRMERESIRFGMAQERFVKDINDIEEELKQLGDQRKRLSSEVQETDTALLNTRKVKFQESNLGHAPQETSHGNSSLSFNAIMGGNGKDPFVAHERILNKYAFVLYTSCNKGKTFYEVRDVEFCPSCEAKTVLCPHKISSGYRIFSLPPNCTHIKLVCPEVPSVKNKVKYQINNDEENVILKSKKFDRLWNDYDTRCGIIHESYMILKETEIVSLIRQFMAFLLWQDEHDAEFSSMALLDLFYIFLENRYLVKSVAYFSAFNMILSLEKYASTDRLVNLFALSLAKEMDMASLRYVLLLGDYIDKVHWQNTDDFLPFFQLLYPSLSEDELEYFKMEYVSFSENSMSKNLLFQYILALILSNKEPLMRNMQSQLYKWPVRIVGYFTEVEFSEVIDSISPLSSDRLRMLLYRQSEQQKDKSEGNIPLLAAVQIAGYLSALQLAPKSREDINKFASSLKEQRKEVPLVPSDVDDFSSVVKYASVKALGAKLARNFRIKKLFK